MEVMGSNGSWKERAVAPAVQGIFVSRSSAEMHGVVSQPCMGAGLRRSKGRVFQEQEPLSHMESPEQGLEAKVIIKEVGGERCCQGVVKTRRKTSHDSR